MPANDPRQALTRPRNLLLINLLITIILPRFTTIFGGPTDYLLSFLAGFIVLGIVSRRYAMVIVWSSIFVVYVAWEIILSSIATARLVLQPKPDLDPGIIAVPLRVKTELEITVLAWAVGLTPGTLCLELLRGENREAMLYIHALQVKNPDQMRAAIRNGFEAMILRISNGATT